LVFIDISEKTLNKMGLSGEIVPKLIALQKKLCKTCQRWNSKQDHQKTGHG